MPRGWKPVDFIATIIALTVCAILATSIAGAVIEQREISEGGREIIDNVIAALLAIVSMYVGASIQKKHDDER